MLLASLAVSLSPHPALSPKGRGWEARRDRIDLLGEERRCLGPGSECEAPGRWSTDRRTGQWHGSVFVGGLGEEVAWEGEGEEAGGDEECGEAEEGDVDAPGGEVLGFVEGDAAEEEDGEGC